MFYCRRRFRPLSGQAEPHPTNLDARRGSSREGFNQAIPSTSTLNLQVTSEPQKKVVSYLALNLRQPLLAQRLLQVIQALNQLGCGERRW
ncbi:hypothetical protein DMX12_23895 [Pseudomonas sp. MB-090624]|nr:hypothetical protein DMX12_23895 [Pseudomonas sp. MB-090624]